MIIGQKKPRAGTAHSIFYQNSINNKNVFLPSPRTTLDDEQRVSAFKRIYGFLFLEPGHIKAPAAAAPTPPPVRKVAKPAAVPKKTTQGASFNLDKFLELMPAVNHASYKTAVSYFATLGLDPSETQRKCNAVWNPDPDNRGETGRFMRNLQRSGDLRTRKKDFVRMMSDNNVPSHAVDTVFGGGILYLEGHEQFMGKDDVNLKDVEEWYRDRVSRVGFGEKIYFSYYLRNGQDTRRHVTKKCPYTGQNAFVFKTEKEIMVGKKLEKKQVNWSSGKVVKTMMGLGKFKHYTKVDFEPFGPDQKSPTPLGVLRVDWLPLPAVRSQAQSPPHGGNTRPNLLQKNQRRERLHQQVGEDQHGHAWGHSLRKGGVRDGAHHERDGKMTTTHGHVGSWSAEEFKMTSSHSMRTRRGIPAFISSSC